MHAYSHKARDIVKYYSSNLLSLQVIISKLLTNVIFEWELAELVVEAFLSDSLYLYLHRCLHNLSANFMISSFNIMETIICIFRSFICWQTNRRSWNGSRCRHQSFIESLMKMRENRICYLLRIFFRFAVSQHFGTQFRPLTISHISCLYIFSSVYCL